MAAKKASKAEAQKEIDKMLKAAEAKAERIVKAAEAKAEKTIAKANKDAEATRAKTKDAAAAPAEAGGVAVADATPPAAGKQKKGGKGVTVEAAEAPPPVVGAPSVAIEPFEGDIEFIFDPTSPEAAKMTKKARLEAFELAARSRRDAAAKQAADRAAGPAAANAKAASRSMADLGSDAINEDEEDGDEETDEEEAPGTMTSAITAKPGARPGPTTLKRGRDSDESRAIANVQIADEALLATLILGPGKISQRFCDALNDVGGEVHRSTREAVETAYMALTDDVKAIVRRAKHGTPAKGDDFRGGTVLLLAEIMLDAECVVYLGPGASAAMRETEYAAQLRTWAKSRQAAVASSATASRDKASSRRSGNCNGGNCFNCNKPGHIAAECWPAATSAKKTARKAHGRK